MTLFSSCVGYKTSCLILFIFSIPGAAEPQRERNTSFPTMLRFSQIVTWTGTRFASDVTLHALHYHTGIVLWRIFPFGLDFHFLQSVPPPSFMSGYFWKTSLIVSSPWFIIIYNNNIFIMNDILTNMYITVTYTVNRHESDLCLSADRTKVFAKKWTNKW